MTTITLKEYRVGIFEEQGGYVTIKARTPAEAREKAQQYVDDNGIDEGVDTTHRDTMIVDEPKLEA